MPSSEAPDKFRLLGNLRQALKPVVDEGMSLDLLIALITTALEPGLSVNELADRLRVPQQTASRYVAILLGRYQLPSSDLKQAVRFPLVKQQVSADDPRRWALFLTERGQEFLALLTSSLAEEP